MCRLFYGDCLGGLIGEGGFFTSEARWDLMMIIRDEVLWIDTLVVLLDWNLAWGGCLRDG